MRIRFSRHCQKLPLRLIPTTDLERDSWYKTKLRQCDRGSRRATSCIDEETVLHHLEPTTPWNGGVSEPGRAASGFTSTLCGFIRPGAVPQRESERRLISLELSSEPKVVELGVCDASVCEASADDGRVGDSLDVSPPAVPEIPTQGNCKGLTTMLEPVNRRCMSLDPWMDWKAAEGAVVGVSWLCAGVDERLASVVSLLPGRESSWAAATEALPKASALASAASLLLIKLEPSRPLKEAATAGAGADSDGGVSDAGVVGSGAGFGANNGRADAGVDASAASLLLIKLEPSRPLKEAAPAGAGADGNSGVSDAGAVGSGASVGASDGRAVAGVDAFEAPPPSAAIWRRFIKLDPSRFLNAGPLRSAGEPALGDASCLGGSDGLLTASVEVVPEGVEEPAATMKSFIMPEPVEPPGVPASALTEDASDRAPPEVSPMSFILRCIRFDPSIGFSDCACATPFAVADTSAAPPRARADGESESERNSPASGGVWDPDCEDLSLTVEFARLKESGNIRLPPAPGSTAALEATSPFISDCLRRLAIIELSINLNCGCSLSGCSGGISKIASSKRKLCEGEIMGDPLRDAKGDRSSNVRFRGTEFTRGRRLTTSMPSCDCVRSDV
mmetsp:Transcript_2919/g.9941  ORF Transcript_2919/g.9941 Transcript_2919/m.9941 type:complete len:619 (-) Transcript_2919:2113-3969(-)